MAKVERFYWDACAWLGLLNEEASKHRELRIIWDRARRGECTIWTSTLSMVEVFKKRCEKGDPKPLSEENDIAINDLFLEPHVVLINLTPRISTRARKLLRQHPQLKKAPDAVHLASALDANCDRMHTYDGDDLLHLSEKELCRDGRPLPISLPDASTDGPLFSAEKSLRDHPAMGR
ncbi:tRNA(fMet)-specific endonuclease VapC [compost metagenome]